MFKRKGWAVGAVGEVVLAVVVGGGCFFFFFPEEGSLDLRSEAE